LEQRRVAESDHPVAADLQAGCLNAETLEVLMLSRLVSLIWLGAALLSAQGPYGRITGRVVDGSGSAVPGATVKVINADTNVVTAATSDAEGNYEARNLIPGPSVSEEEEGAQEGSLTGHPRRPDFGCHDRSASHHLLRGKIRTT